MKRLVHSFVSLVVALPLGAGGFCCCLIGHGHDDAAPAAAFAVESHSCCSGSEAPAPADPEPDHRCECPARELAVFAKTTTAPALYESASAVGDLLSPPAAFTVLLTAEAAPVPPVAHPPPRPPLDRTPSLLRC